MSAAVLAILDEIITAVAGGATVAEAVAATGEATIVEQLAEHTGKAAHAVEKDIVQMAKKKSKSNDSTANVLDISIDSDDHLRKRKEPRKRENMPRRMRPIPDEEDVEMTTEAPTVTERAMAKTTSADSRSEGIKNQETSLVDLGYAIYRPFKDTTQVLLPLHAFANWSITSASAVAGAYRFKCRMNSITDCFDSDFNSPNTNPDPSSDVNVGTATSPAMKAYWETIYRYFSVVACKYRITWRMDTRATDSPQAMVYQYLHGQQDPPLVDGGGTNIIAHEFRQHHPNCTFKVLDANAGYSQVRVYDPAGEAPSDQWAHTPLLPNTNQNKIMFAGIWRPGTIKHEVLEDQYQETWTRMNAAPKQHEYLTYILTHSPYGTQAAMSGRVFVDLEYIVQLKDLDIRYQYITPGVTLPAVTNFANSGNRDSNQA